MKPILHHLREMLDHLLTDVMKHNEFVHTLLFTIALEDGSILKESVSPSRPTVRSDTLYRLLVLRVAGLSIHTWITMIGLEAERVEFFSF